MSSNLLVISGLMLGVLVLVLCINLTTKRLAARLDPRRN